MNRNTTVQKGISPISAVVYISLMFFLIFTLLPFIDDAFSYRFEYNAPNLIMAEKDNLAKKIKNFEDSFLGTKSFFVNCTPLNSSSLKPCSPKSYYMENGYFRENDYCLANDYYEANEHYGESARYRMNKHYRDFEDFSDKEYYEGSDYFESYGQNNYLRQQELKLAKYLNQIKEENRQNNYSRQQDLKLSTHLNQIKETEGNLRLLETAIEELNKLRIARNILEDHYRVEYFMAFTTLKRACLDYKGMFKQLVLMGFKVLNIPPKLLIFLESFQDATPINEDEAYELFFLWKMQMYIELSPGNKKYEEWQITVLDALGYKDFRRYQMLDT